MLSTKKALDAAVKEAADRYNADPYPGTLTDRRAVVVAGKTTSRRYFVGVQFHPIGLEVGDLAKVADWEFPEGLRIAAVC